MKDYTLTEKEQKKFILYFEEIEEKLIVHYASGKIEEMKNTEENKRKLLNKMEEQVRNAEEFEEEQQKKMSEENHETLLYLVITILWILVVIFSKDASSGLPLLHLMLIGINALNTSNHYTNMQKYKRNLTDLEKNEMYLEFSQIREEESIRILEEMREAVKENGASKKQLEKIPKSLENLDEEININTIDKLSYLEMKQMLENAKKLREMQFLPTEQQTYIENNEPKTFREKRQEYLPLEEEEVYTFQRRWKIQKAKEEQNNK